MKEYPLNSFPQPLISLKLALIMKWQLLYEAIIILLYKAITIYVISRQTHTFSCNYGMIVLITAKIALKCVWLPICVIILLFEQPSSLKARKDIQAQISSLLDSLVHSEQNESNLSSTACFLHELWSIKQAPVIFHPTCFCTNRLFCFFFFPLICSKSIYQIRLKLSQSIG